MNLVECRYNPNHKMKPGKREIHEQKCPDRFKCRKKFKYCPYDPLELIPENEYDKHLLECKSRPKITAEEEEEIKRAKTLNNIPTEREQIEYARKKYYKGCVEEPEIPGLTKSKQQQKKNNKKLKEKFSELNKKEADDIIKMAEKTNDNENEDDNKHEIDNFEGDHYFEPDKDEEEEEKIKNNFKKFEKINEEIIIGNDKSGEIKNNKKEEVHKKSIFYEYDPNEEDEDINKYSANIINPDLVNEILGKY